MAVKLPIKILVPIKRVVDYRVKIRVKSDHSGVETEHVKMSINPFDEIAIEEAVRLKEQGMADEVIVVSIGDTKVEENLRAGLALGADRAILVQTEQALMPSALSKVLQSLVEKTAPGLVIMGKQAIDSDHNQTGQMLAARLKWPQATFASSVNVENDRVSVIREIDAGLETLSLSLPAVITTDLRLNEPRIAALPNIMQAKQKPLEQIALADLNIDTHSAYQVLKVEPPAERTGGKILENVEALVAELKQTKVI